MLYVAKNPKTVLFRGLKWYFHRRPNHLVYKNLIIGYP